MELGHHCGLFGIYSSLPNKKIIQNTIVGLENLQHRGRESAGISFINSLQEISIYKNLGLVKEIFQSYEPESTNSCIGHVRYSTTGKKSYKNKLDKMNTIQPLYGIGSTGEYAIAHNGNIPNVKHLAQKLGIALKSDSDSELFIQLIQQSQSASFEDKLIEIMNQIVGVYSLLIQTPKAIYAIKDRYGVRPLCISQNQNIYCISSESTYTAGCHFLRELCPGEIVKIDESGHKTIYQWGEKSPVKPSFCLFEIIYFMKHTSRIYNNTINNYRYQFGFKLGEQEDIIKGKHHLITSIPNAAIPSAKGYADAIRLPYTPVFMKKDGTGRTFILPTKQQRYNTNRIGLKIRDNIDLTQIKSIVLVDDSLVRGNTIANIISKIKQFRVQEIHLRIPSPPIRSQCYYGIDIPTKEELIAHNRTPEEIAKILGITSLRYLDYSTMSQMFDNTVCGCCFTGKYEKLCF